MRICFLGNFDVPYSTESHHKWTYEKLGHEVIALREAETPIETIRQHALSSDLFVWTHTHNWITPGAKELLAELKEKGIPSVGYHLDLWIGIDRQKDLETDPYWDIEYFFATDGPMVEYLNSRDDMPKAFYLPAGVVEYACKPGKYRLELAADVAFVGSRGYHREWAYRPRLIDWLKETYGDKFKHWGGDGLGVMREDDLNNVYTSTRVIIGDTLCKDFKYPNYFSDRLFETTGRGGFLIFPYIEGIRDLFTEDELVTYKFNDFNDLKNKIDYYLKRDIERDVLRRRGYIRTYTDHTYTRRLSKLLDTLKKEGALNG